jgi:4'-phosphopantetheinyl transferase
MFSSYRELSLADDNIGAGDVDLWCVWLPAYYQSVDKLAEVLKPTELDRASRYVFQRGRFESIITRGLLRHILSLYLNEGPNRIEFVYGPFGKPGIRGEAGLYFNLSHSGHKLVVAISKSCEVGVDIESVNPELPCRDMESIFSPAEREALAATSSAARDTAFFKCWTAKEAYIKGVGRGLSLPLAEFDVCVDPDKPPRLLRPWWGSDIDWHLHGIDTGADYVATLATTSAAPCIRTLRGWIWHPETERFWRP